MDGQIDGQTKRVVRWHATEQGQHLTVTVKIKRQKDKKTKRQKDKKTKCELTSMTSNDNLIQK